MELENLARLLNITLSGDGATDVDSVASLVAAKSNSLTFFSDKRRLDDLSSCEAGAVILRETDAHLFDGPKLICQDPYAAFVKAC